MSEAVKLCPFCGSEPIACGPVRLSKDDPYGYVVGCKNPHCYASVFLHSPCYLTLEDAINEWNRRTVNE